ncbi:unnamed protein product [Caenorhabditis bovis]|uniref:F-box domain-containing protein n=1 Tax=Caenorhabditis bovis TaxID=2654633 RepID=A0A8S1F5N0_9PELO|nr:unnamed protein product [Caenorhabditis bovis]
MVSKRAKFDDKKFVKWPDLPAFLQEIVISNLDFRTRISLSECSKSMRLIEADAPLNLNLIEITDNEFYCGFRENNVGNEAVRVKIRSTNNGETHSAIFMNMGDDAEIVFPKYPRRESIILRHTNYYEAGVRLFEDLLKRSKYRVENCFIEMANWDIGNSTVQQQLRGLKIMRIAFCSAQNLRDTLRIVPNNLDRLDLLDRNYGSLSTMLSPQILGLAQIGTAKTLNCHAFCELTDESLASLKAHEATFSALSITNEMLNNFIKRWIDGDVAPTVKRVQITARNAFSVDAILNGVEHLIEVDRQTSGDLNELRLMSKSRSASISINDSTFVFHHHHSIV